jgi:hypothetical protein
MIGVLEDWDGWMNKMFTQSAKISVICGWD